MKLSLAAAVASSAAFIGCANAFTAPLGGSGAFVTRSSVSVRSTAAGTYHAASSATSLTMSIKDITSGAEEKMGKSVDSVKLNLQTVRTGRANASILDRVMVEYYGAPTPLNQLATVSVPSSQQLQIDPYDKSVTAEIEKAIIESGIGLTPNNDGDVIRINIPSLTEDRYVRELLYVFHLARQYDRTHVHLFAYPSCRRKELLKQCKEIGEEGKVAVRNVRRDGVDKIKKMEKNSEVGKDEMADGLDAMQSLTDKYGKEIDDTVAAKEKEVMTV